MKQGKKLNRKMIKFLEDKGLNPNDYLVERKTSKEICFIKKGTKEILNFKCDWGKV